MNKFEQLYILFFISICGKQIVAFLHKWNRVSLVYVRPIEYEVETSWR